MKRIWSTAAALVSIGTSTLAFAGGFEYPGQGTEAMGRGAAFTAKADDGTAFDYNVAGFAKQRGTRVLFDSNLIWNSLSFQRAGSYPDAYDPAGSNTTEGKPYGGAAFPTIHNSAGAGYVPFVALSTDFGYFDRWTFAIGLFAPNSVSSRTYPTTVTTSTGVTAPAPQRYDVTTINPLIAFPSLAAAFRATRWFDIGIAAHLVYANLDLANDSLVYLSSGLCHNAEDAGCDGYTRLKTTGITGSASLGLMFHPTRSLDIGANVRPQINVHTTGKATAASPPSLSNIPLSPGSASFDLALPTTLKVGIRYAFRGADNFEHGDLELDGDYENWKNAEGDGDHVKIPQLTPLRNIDPTITHHYLDTYSARFGGAYNARLPVGVFTVRGGLFFDSAATKYKDTRVDFDTMAKYGVTSGLGYTVRGISIDVAYAYVYEPDRNVQNGDIRSINGVTNGSTSLGAGAGDTPVINNGMYKAHNNMLSVGLKIAWEDLLNRHKRVIKWQ